MAYDLKLEELLDQIKLQIWLNEELQIQPKSQTGTLIHSYKKLYSFKYLDL